MEVSQFVNKALIAKDIIHTTTQKCTILL